MPETRRAHAWMLINYYNIGHFSSYLKFGVSFWYKRTGGPSDTQGIITNGDCETDPSILITSGSETVGVKFHTYNDDVDVPSISVWYNTFPHSTCPVFWGRRNSHRRFFWIVFSHKSFFPVSPCSCLCLRRPSTLSSDFLFFLIWVVSWPLPAFSHFELNWILFIQHRHYTYTI